MKRKILLTLLIISFTLTSSALASSTFSIGVGSFTPKDDVMSSFDTGYTVTASYVTAASDLFAYGVDLAFNQTEATGKIGVFEDKVTLSTLGLEALIYIQPKDAKVQPFVGAGIGLYVNNLNAKLNNVEYFDDSGSGFGFVGKAGLRLFLDNKFYIGGYGKYYSNDQDFENYDKSKTTHNLGGTCFVFEIGLKL